MYADKRAEKETNFNPILKFRGVARYPVITRDPGMIGDIWSLLGILSAARSGWMKRFT